MAEPSTSYERKKPKDILFDDIVIDVAFHPSKDVIASAHICGEVNVHSYSTTSENQNLMTLDHHKKSCRCLCFSEDGNQMFTASKDKSLCCIDMNTGTESWSKKKAHECPIYSLLLTGENFIATGDDDGRIKVWDTRTRACTMELKECEEFISDMTIDKNHKLLLATSGEGTLTVFNIRQKKLLLQSELFDSEMLSLAIVKNGTKVVCGTGEGVLNIFNWNEFNNISDRFPGHPMSIDCIVPITEDIICTGSLDGAVRAVHILPNRFLGVLGRHGDLAVENLSVCRDKRLLASCSHDQTIKFWNLDLLDDIEVKHEKAKVYERHRPLNPQDQFFDDLAQDADPANLIIQESDDDDDESEDDKDSNDHDTGEESIEVSGSSSDDDDDDDNDDDGNGKNGKT